MQRNNTTTKEKNVPGGVVVEAGMFGIVIIILCLLTLSFCINKGVIGERIGTLAAELSIFAASVLTGAVAARKGKNRRAQLSLIASVPILFALVLVAVFFENCSVINIKMAINLVVIVGGTMIGCILTSKRGYKKWNRHR